MYQVDSGVSKKKTNQLIISFSIKCDSLTHFRQFMHGIQ